MTDTEQKEITSFKDKSVCDALNRIEDEIEAEQRNDEHFGSNR